MTGTVLRDWRSVKKEVLRRIHAREWKPGDMIPNETDLADEFGCARTTVNRALRSVAESGLLDRRRKAGTRVAEHPVARATLDIPLIRNEIEARGRKYGYQLIKKSTSVPPPAVSGAMRTMANSELLYIQALHLADDKPYVIEDRWINTKAVPCALEEPFEIISSNEWLLRYARYTHGDIAFSASSASEIHAKILCCPAHSALFVVDRLTWDGSNPVTKVTLLFAPGHQLRTEL